MSLPLGAAALFIELRARMHGLVTLELVGHLHPFNDHGAAFFDAYLKGDPAGRCYLHQAGKENPDVTVRSR